MDTGLPDGTFPDQKSQLWLILVGHGMEDLGRVYGHLGT
jgi:hypothetical protein